MEQSKTRLICELKFTLSTVSIQVIFHFNFNFTHLILIFFRIYVQVKCISKSLKQHTRQTHRYAKRPKCFNINSCIWFTGISCKSAGSSSVKSRIPTQSKTNHTRFLSIWCSKPHNQSDIVWWSIAELCAFETGSFRTNFTRRRQKWAPKPQKTYLVWHRQRSLEH